MCVYVCVRVSVRECECVCLYIKMYVIRESVSGYDSQVFANVLITFFTVLPYMYCVCVCGIMHLMLHVVLHSFYRCLRIVLSLFE